MFKDYCDCIIDRYGLRKGIIKQEVVQDISYGTTTVSEYDHYFTIRTNTGVHFARTVVMAVGAGNAPSIPQPFPSNIAEGACHAMQMKQFPDPCVTAKMNAGKKTNVVVCGGGLTSAQVADMAIRHGVTKVWHIMRGPLKGVSITC